MCISVLPPRSRVSMDWLLLLFQAVSVVFAISAVATGVQALVDPTAFSAFFGLPLHSNEDTSRTTGRPPYHRGLAASYVSLMGVRQLATGLTLLLFAYQSKWTDLAAILAILGILVAGTDGAFLYQAGHRQAGVFHAMPGALISALAASVLYSAD